MTFSVLAFLERDLVGIVKDKREFKEFLQQNFRWIHMSVDARYQQLRDMYFPNLETMSDAQINENMATVSNFMHY